MNENSPEYFVGHLVFERLFIGSKSEGLFPMLHTDQGRKYRLHVKGDSFGCENSLITYSGKLIKVWGLADKVRGHWRIVLDGDESCLVHESLPNDSDSMLSETPESELKLPRSNDSKGVL